MAISLCKKKVLRMKETAKFPTQIASGLCLLSCALLSYIHIALDLLKFPGHTASRTAMLQEGG